MKKVVVSTRIAVLMAVVLLMLLVGGIDRIIRRGAPTLDVSISEIALENGHFTMTASQGGNSGTSFRHSAYEIEDDTLYVTLYSGLVYGGYRADTMRVDIQEDELNEVRQVYLRNNSAQKLIYSK